MDRKAHNLNFLYTYPPYPSAPTAFSVNGVTYVAQPEAGAENIGMGIPAFNLYPTNPRGLHRQTASYAHQEPSASHTTTAAAATAAANPGRNAPPTGNKTAPGPDITGSLVPSRPSSPMTVDVAIQCLSGYLQDAVRLCTESLAAHAKVVDAAQFTSEATRNAIWRDLLQNRLRTSGFAQDGFHNLGKRLKFYMDAAEQAAGLEQGDDHVDARREAKGRVRRLRVLRAECAEVVRLAEGAAGDALDCREMLGMMKDMKEKLGGSRGDRRRSVDGKKADGKKADVKKAEGDKADEEGQNEGGTSGEATSTGEDW